MRIWNCRFEEYLEAAAAFARTQWTQFNVPVMAAGLAVFLVAIGVQLALLAVRARRLMSQRRMPCS